MEIGEKADQVKTKKDLVDFIRNLIEDLQKNKSTWENPTLETYLEAMAAWIEDSDGYYLNQNRPVPIEPTWNNVADMLIAAKMYE
ncbi:MAG: hypothetical protein JWO30_4468 [Fibrobacteres bacterium]|nr:hypothetical protein [Fibrobacterota bacterium]